MKTIQTIIAFLFAVSAYSQDVFYQDPDHNKIALFDKSYVSDERLYFEASKNITGQEKPAKKSVITFLSKKVEEQKIPKTEFFITYSDKQIAERFFLVREDKEWEIIKSLK